MAAAQPGAVAEPGAAAIVDEAVSLIDRRPDLYGDLVK